MRHRRHILSWLLVLTLAWGAASCIPKIPDDFKSEDELYNYSMDLVERKKYFDALRFLGAFRDRYPISPRTPTVLLTIGDIHFKQREWIEALATYEQFTKLNPSHPRYNYAVFQMAKTHKKQIPGTIDRDQTNVQNALNLFTSVQNDPEFNKEAQKEIVAMNLLLARRERYVADYYLKRKKWKAAETRLVILIDRFAFDSMQSEALADLVKVYSKLGETAQANMRFEQLKKLGKPEVTKRASGYLKTNDEKSN